MYVIRGSNVKGNTNKGYGLINKAGSFDNDFYGEEPLD